MVFFQKLAEICGQYLTKGSKIYVEGELKTRKWQDKDGRDRYTTEIVCNEMQMLDSKSSNNNTDLQKQMKSQDALFNGAAFKDTQPPKTQQAQPPQSDIEDQEIPF